MADSSSGDGGFSIRPAVHVVGLIVLVLIVGLFVVASVPALVGADESYVVRSDSMSPSIKAGSVVIVGETPTSDIETGDVITYESGSGDPVTHRVIEIREADAGPRFVTQGDANEDPDPTPVSPAAVIGTVSFHIPLIGYVISFAGTDLGLVALVVIPATILVLLEVRDLWQSADDSSEWEGKL